MSEETYWQQGDQRAYSPLRGRRTADAVVVGGGLTGLTVALWLCRAGLRVVLLEANTLGSGSTACCLGRVSLFERRFAVKAGKTLRAGMGQRLRKLSAECLSHFARAQPGENSLMGLADAGRPASGRRTSMRGEGRISQSGHFCRNRNVLFVSLCGEGMSAASKHGGAASAAVSAFSGPSGRKTRIMHL